MSARRYLNGNKSQPIVSVNVHSFSVNVGGPSRKVEGIKSQSKAGTLFNAKDFHLCIVPRDLHITLTPNNTVGWTEDLFFVDIGNRRTKL